MTDQVKDNQPDIAQALVTLVEQSMDLSGVQVLYVMYPNPIPMIKDSVNITIWANTKQGKRPIAVYADSEWMDRSQTSKTTFLIHENMHRYGYAGHSPGYPGGFTIATNQSGAGQNMDTWDRLVLDWLQPGDVYCVEKSQLQTIQITLVPQEREQAGTQGIMVKLDDHRLLVIESHRRDKWGQEFRSGFYGLTAYLVDTSRDTDRSGENFGDDEKGTKFSRTVTAIQFTEYNNGHYSKGQENFELNYMLFEGQTFTFEGVKFTLTKTGDNDSVKLEKVA